ncbi:MAG: GNAT family N-acetyltransferase [Deltaproteobacteria bacterium]|nr:GNAT family N-acetyltransferase [Deltaproteobacteria bacterium]
MTPFRHGGHGKKGTRGKWKDKVVSPTEVLQRIKPGMSIFLSTGVAEPRTLVKSLMESDAPNLQDLELIQMVSLGDAISSRKFEGHKFRLKTFFSGWVASKAISEGTVDLVPARFSEVPFLISEGRLDIDAAFVQITPPDENGWASLGVSVDTARKAMECASLKVAEIQPQMPRTLGDTFVHIDSFDLTVKATEPLLVFSRSPVAGVFDKVARNVASLIEDKSCLAWSMEQLFEALWLHLAKKRDLGVHSPFITDALMDLVSSGAVTNRFKGSFRNKCLCSYALGTEKLMHWLDENPLVEFQAVDVLGDPDRIRRNEKFVAILPARRVDLTGQFAFHSGRGNLGIGPSVAWEFIHGAHMSKGGRVIVALPSRNREGQPNILVSIEDYPNQYTNRETIDLVVTEYGVASMTGRTVRERAQALIDIAHPDDREELVRQAKERNILYKDQIYLVEAGRLYPSDVEETRDFGDLTVRFRPIRPSDEDQMRRLFYRFSSEAVYYRYFAPIKTMPHAKMQEYVNVDYERTMSIVGLIGEAGEGRIIAEGRYVMLPDRPWADCAFVVDEDYQGRGIATHLYRLLIREARKRGIKGFTADVLATNKTMLKVFEKSPYPVSAKLEGGAYHLSIDFSATRPGEGGSDKAVAAKSS